MKNCKMNDFMQELAPWLDSDYIREARKDAEGHVVLLFQDGVENVYHIEDCTGEQVDGILKDLQARGITVL